MSARNWGNVPFFSTTAATSADPSTTTIVAELILSTGSPVPSANFEVRFSVGASTGALWLLEHCVSSGLGSTAITKQIAVFTGSNQTAEYVFSYRADRGDRFRVRVGSTFTGTAAATIQAESLT